MVKGGGSTVGFEFVDVGQELQQTVEVVLGGAAPQHGEQQHRGLALHPLQRESTRGRRAAVPQLQQWGNESAITQTVWGEDEAQFCFLTVRRVFWKSSSFSLASEKFL